MGTFLIKQYIWKRRHQNFSNCKQNIIPLPRYPLSPLHSLGLNPLSNISLVLINLVCVRVCVCVLPNVDQLLSTPSSINLKPKRIPGPIPPPPLLPSHSAKLASNSHSMPPFTGLSSEEKLHGVKYITESFVGCIRNVVLSSGKAASDLLPIVPLVATKHENVNEGCSDMCDSRQNLCFVGSRCINHYSGISCDCFGTHYEGEHCDIYSEYAKERETAKRAVLSLPLSLSICVCGLPSGCAAWQRHFVLIINYVCLLAVSHGSTTTSLPLHLPPASLPLPQPGLACSFKHANDLTINYAK